MIEDQYSVNIYFLVVFDINLDVTLCSLFAAGFSAVPAVFFFFFVYHFTCTSLGLHMGLNNLWYVTRHFLVLPMSHVTFYKTLTSLSTVFIKDHVGHLQLLKWLCPTSFFTHVEPITI